MINNKQINKIMSVTLTMSLLISLLIPGLARAEPEADTNPTPVKAVERKLTVDYLGYGVNAPGTDDQSPARLTQTWADLGWADKKFWIGVAVDKIHDLDLFTQGIFNLEIAFDYDPEYIEPYYDDNQTWKEALEAANFQMGASNTDPVYWNSTYYGLEKVLTNVDLVTGVDREDIEHAEANKADDPAWKMCYVQISPLARDSLVTTERRFYQTTDQGKQYLIRMPFKLKKIPDNPLDHPIVLSLTRGPTTFVIGSDEFGTMPYAAWEQTVQHNEEDDSHNLKTMFGYGGDIDLFSDDLPYISDITAFQGNPSDGAAAEQYNLYHDKSLNDYLFKNNIMDYYIKVPNTTSSLDLKITGAFPIVTHNGNQISVGRDGVAAYKFKTTEKIPLVAYNPDTDVGDPYDKNTIQVKYNTTVYTLHVYREAAEPEASPTPNPDDQDIGLKVTKGDPEEELTLTERNYTTPKPFVADDTSTDDPNEYWVRVDKDTDAVKIHVTADGYTGSTEINSVTENFNLTNGTDFNEITGLEPVIKTKSDGTLEKDDNGDVIINGTNDVTVTLADSSGNPKTYIIHIQRLGEGGIDLNPGNSPYGMIERMREKYHGATGAWTNEQIEAVKAKLFDHSADTPTTARYKFRNTLDVNGVTMSALPDGADTSIFYQPMAWGNGALNEPSYDPAFNMDMNDNALFIYQKQPFKDPGFTAYDEAGQEIDLEDPDVTITRVVKDVKKMRVIDMLELDDSQSGDVTLETDETDGLVHNLTYFTTGSKLIRPDIYNLEYTISRPDKADIKIIRKLILLAKRGDVNLDDDINSNDGTRIRNHYQGIQNIIPTGLDSRIAKLYNYKIADVNLDGDISSNDETRIRNHYQSVARINKEIYNKDY